MYTYLSNCLVSRRIHHDDDDEDLFNRNNRHFANVIVFLITSINHSKWKEGSTTATISSFRRDEMQICLRRYSRYKKWSVYVTTYMLRWKPHKIAEWKKSLWSTSCNTWKNLNILLENIMASRLKAKAEWKIELLLQGKIWIHAHCCWQRDCSKRLEARNALLLNLRLKHLLFTNKKLDSLFGQFSFWRHNICRLAFLRKTKTFVVWSEFFLSCFNANLSLFS